MSLRKRREADYDRILREIVFHVDPAENGYWSSDELSLNSVTQTSFFNELANLTLAYVNVVELEESKSECAYRFFGLLCSYVLKKNSIKNAAKLLSALEIMGFRDDIRCDVHPITKLTANVLLCGFEKAGTNMLSPFIGVFNRLGLNLQTIRAQFLEDLAIELGKTNEEKKEIREVD